MNRLIPFILALATTAFVAPALAADMKDMKMDQSGAMGQMKMDNREAKSKKATMAKSMGVIKSIDIQNRLVTIAHEPVKELKWPAMTMEFMTLDESLLAGLKSGDKIHFSFMSMGKHSCIYGKRSTNPILVSAKRFP